MRKKQSEIKKIAKQILRKYGYYLCESKLIRKEIQTPNGIEIITHPIWEKSLGLMISEMCDDKLFDFVSEVKYHEKTNPSNTRSYIESYNETLKKSRYRFDF
jgi:hypothetical protein